jgi:dihydrolipoamide dehydrogenase
MNKNMNYDILIIGSGPGGYVSAIRASQLGMKVAVIERAELGGICLNWGCIPTKTLLKSAEVFQYIKHSADYGISIDGDAKVNFLHIIERSRKVADNMSKGVQYLFKKNKIEVIKGFGKLIDNKTVKVIDKQGNESFYVANHIILATGAHSREFPNLRQDGKKIIGYREALTLPKRPKSMIVVGSGTIGTELSYFYNAMGSEITLVEIMPYIIPLEDQDISKQLSRSFKKAGIKIMTNALVESINVNNDKCEATIKTDKGEEVHTAETVFSPVGISPNFEGLGIEEMKIELEKGKIKVDDYYQTNIKGIYAIGDIVHGQALAHVASAEGIVCVEKIAGKNPKTINYKNIPCCTYTMPEIASIGLTEKKAQEAGYEIRTGKFPFTASGKANSSGERQGFVKLIFNADNDKLLGAHMIGANVTEMISELVLAKELNITGPDIIKSVFPHPTMSEAIKEAAANAYNEAIHI